MSAILPWALFSLGVGHVLYGCVKYRAPLQAAVASGFVGEFGSPEVRRTAFWVVLFGPMLMLAGQVTIHAAAVGDVQIIKLVAMYFFGVSAIGVFAMPKSPFLAGLVVSTLLLAQGFGYF